MGVTETIETVRVKHVKIVRFNLQSKFDLRSFGMDDKNTLVLAMQLVAEIALNPCPQELGFPQRIEFRRKLETALLKEVFKFGTTEPLFKDFLEVDCEGGDPNRDDVDEIYNWLWDRLHTGFSEAVKAGMPINKSSDLFPKCEKAIQVLRDDAIHKADLNRSDTSRMSVDPASPGPSTTTVGEVTDKLADIKINSE